MELIGVAVIMTTITSLAATYIFGVPSDKAAHIAIFFGSFLTGAALDFIHLR